MSNASSEHDKSNRFPARGAQVPWGPVSVIFLSVLAFVGAQVLATVVLGSLFGPDNAEELLTVRGQFYFVLISDILIALILWLFLRSRRARLGQLGFGRRPVWKDLGYAAGGYVAYFGLLIMTVGLIGLAVEIDVGQRQELGFDNLLGTPERLMALLSLVILPPIIEETVFRGFVFTGLRQKMRFVWATAITSLLFAWPHLLASSDGLLWIAGVDTLVLSVVLCYLREKTGSLWAPIVLHAIKNGIAYILLLSSTVTL